MDRIKRLSYKVLEEHQSKFNENFSDNKKLLDDLTIIRSKGLKNEIAGYITKFIKNQNRNLEIQKSKEEAALEEVSSEEPVMEQPESETEPQEVIEVGVDSEETPEPTKPSEEQTE